MRRRYTAPMPPVVGVCAIQGDFEKHIEAIEGLKMPGLKALEVRTPEDLAGVDCLILPGGESTTVGQLMQRFGLGQAIQERAADGMPVWGTCMGMILMARHIAGRPEQWSLGLLDVTVERNAFGAQIHSFEAEIPVEGIEGPIEAVFIRAPIVTQMGADVEPLAEYEGKVVAVRQGRLLGTSFHPELTGDGRLHRMFIDSAR